MKKYFYRRYPKSPRQKWTITAPAAVTISGQAIIAALVRKRSHQPLVRM